MWGGVKGYEGKGTRNLFVSGCSMLVEEDVFDKSYSC
jgi:hypothetical protein